LSLLWLLTEKVILFHSIPFYSILLNTFNKSCPSTLISLGSLLHRKPVPLAQSHGQQFQIPIRLVSLKRSIFYLLQTFPFVYPHDTTPNIWCQYIIHTLRPHKPLLIWLVSQICRWTHRDVVFSPPLEALHPFCVCGSSALSSIAVMHVPAHTIPSRHCPIKFVLQNCNLKYLCFFLISPQILELSGSLSTKLTAWQQNSRQDETSHHFCHILHFGRKSTNPAHTQEEGITQRLKYH
jgi:hypothetical protein